MNKVILIGRVGKDPEKRSMSNGESVANLSLATSEKWKDKQTGDQKEATEWHRLVAYGRTADIAAQYALKGVLICVEGSLKTRKWTDKDGVERYATEIQVRDLHLLSKSAGTSDQGAGRPAAANAPQQQRAPQQRQASASFDDDIPF